MKLNLANLINSHKGKTAIVCGLGNSLNENLSWIEDKSKNDKDNYSVFCCNLYYRMTNITPDFWLVSNPQPEMQIETMAEQINSFDGVFLYSELNNISQSTGVISNKTTYIELSNEVDGLRLMVGSYCNEPEPAYKGVDSVIIHLIALAIICGCKEVLIAGADLDYAMGYVDGSKTFGKGVVLGQSIMPHARERIVKDISTLKKYAKNIGVNVRVIDNDTYLSKKINE